MNFFYKLYIMQTMTKHKVQPNANFIERLEQDVAHAKKMIVKKVNIPIILRITVEHIKHSFIFTVRRYASEVYTVVVCLSVRLSQVGLLPTRLNTGSCKQRCTIA